MQQPHDAQPLIPARPARSKLDALLAEADETAAWLANELEVSKQLVAMWRRGMVITERRREPIAKILTRKLGRPVTAEEVC